jgi:hypothetical protein
MKSRMKMVPLAILVAAGMLCLPASTKAQNMTKKMGHDNMKMEKGTMKMNMGDLKIAFYATANFLKTPYTATVRYTPHILTGY